MAYKVTNPSTGEEVKNFDFISDVDLIQKIKLSDDIFHKFKNYSFEQRAKILLKVADLLEKNVDEYARIMTTEMGKPILQSRAEVMKSANVCRYYAINAEIFLKSQTIENSSAYKTLVQFEPMGIIFAVMPWNFPFWQVFRFLAPNFMAGNSALLKHASNVPMSAEAIENIFLEAGSPEGVFQNLFINYEQIETLIADHRVRGVTLTGSNLAGGKVASIAGKHVKKSVLELGGSDPFIVLNDADLDKAVEAGVISRMLNNGQSCIAAKRFIIQSGVYDDFLHKFKTRVESLKIGDPMNEENYIGPIPNQYLLEELEEQVNKSVDMGATIVCGGERAFEDGFYYKPTILTNIRNDSPAYKEEIFGPVATFFKADTEEEIITLANDSQFGLGASIFSKNIEKSLQLAGKIITGTVAINDFVKSNPKFPFGGTKNSGYGRELSDYGIREFVNLKSVVVKL